MWKAAVLVAMVCNIVDGCVYKNRECEPYTVDEQHGDYEVRSYSALTWVSTTEESSLIRIAQYNAFMRLFNYISGKNDRNLKINMTVPVKMRNTANGDNVIMEMSFMVPSELAANPPVPENDKVVISHDGPTKYAVRSFSGYVWRQSTWEEEAEKLANSVKDDATVDSSEFYRVGYDAPTEFFERRNEIWMAKKPTPETNEV